MIPFPLVSSAHPLEVWRWALTVLFAAGVMVGLLGMHTLSSGHAELPVGTTVSAVGHDHSMVESEPSHHTGADVGGGCVDCDTSGHDALMMVCLLGLLVTLLLVGRPASGLTRTRHPLFTVPALSAPWSRVPPPPSLLELSISRT